MIPCPRECPAPARSPRSGSAPRRARRGSPPWWSRARRHRRSPAIRRPGSRRHGRDGRTPPPRPPALDQLDHVGETVGLGGIDNDHPLHRAKLDPGRIRDVELVGVQRDERRARFGSPRRAAGSAAPGYSRRAASAEPSASKSALVWVVISSRGRMAESYGARAPTPALVDGDDLDLNRSAGRQRGDLHGRAGGRILGEVLGVDRVDRARSRRGRSRTRWS